MKIQHFVFNFFQENTYVISSNGECIIVDPGCFTSSEEQVLANYIASEELTPLEIVNTHCHIDHVLGNEYCVNKYTIGLRIPEGEKEMLKQVPTYGMSFGVQVTPSPDPTGFLIAGKTLKVGALVFNILNVPGHSPDHMVLYEPEQKVLIGGDVLFRESIGRTDLPGGNHQLLLQKISEELFVLPDDVIVYPGHGEPTTIGHEKKNNPFLVGFNA